MHRLARLTVFTIAALVVFACSAAPGVSSPQRFMLGRSEQGRPIDAIRVGNPHGTRVLVFGCIHGTECAGFAIAHALEHVRTKLKLDLWIVPNLNPDGYARGSRQNGRGVDLNANWSSQWHGGGRPWDVYYPGPRPFSERETRIARNLILRIRPVVTIWYHQHMNLVWAWGRSSRSGRIYAEAAGMRFYHHDWLNGTATNWQNHHLPNSTSFTVELPAGSLTPKQVRRHVHAVLTLAAAKPKSAAQQRSVSAGPGFRPSAGWHILENGLSAPSTESAAAAANVPFAVRDRNQPTATSTPTQTVAHLARTGIVIWAQFMPRGSHPTIDKNFPPTALPLRVAHTTAIDPPEGFACPPAVTPARCFKASGSIRTLQASSTGYDIAAWVFFGTDHPSTAAVKAADDELTHLSLPACTAAEPLRHGDPRAAARFKLSWFRTHYVGQLSDFRGARAVGRRIAEHPTGASVEVARLCETSTNRIVAVRVTPSGVGRSNLGPQLLYFLARTRAGWVLWRQG